MKGNKEEVIRNYGKCVWCGVDIILPVYVNRSNLKKGQKYVSWAAAHAYQNCGENTGHKFHDDCKKDYVNWLRKKPWNDVSFRLIPQAK